MASTFREALIFFDKIGIYDVILPFLLVFTIVFAIFEKTKVLGTEEIEGKQLTRKNLNAMAAFVISFMVIASSQLVEIITQVSAQMVLLLMMSVFFLLLVGSFMKEGDGSFLQEGGWKTFFMFFMFIGLVLIFLSAIKTENGESWLEWFFTYVYINFTSTAVASIILVVVLVGAMYYIVQEPKSRKDSNS